MYNNPLIFGFIDTLGFEKVFHFVRNNLREVIVATVFQVHHAHVKNIVIVDDAHGDRHGVVVHVPDVVLEAQESVLKTFVGHGFVGFRISDQPEIHPHSRMVGVKPSDFEDFVFGSSASGEGLFGMGEDVFFEGFDGHEWGHIVALADVLAPLLVGLVVEGLAGGVFDIRGLGSVRSLRHARLFLLGQQRVEGEFLDQALGVGIQNVGGGAGTICGGQMNRKGHHTFRFNPVFRHELRDFSIVAW